MTACLNAGTTVVAKASKEFDFDDLLMNIANDVSAKYEKAENKTAVIGYTAAAAAAILTAEWLIHLPLFNVVSVPELQGHWCGS